MEPGTDKKLFLYKTKANTMRNLLRENPGKFQNPFFRAIPVGFLKFQLLNAPNGLYFDLDNTEFLDIFFSLKNVIVCCIDGPCVLLTTRSIDKLLAEHLL